MFVILNLPLDAELNLMPVPSSVQQSSGQLTIDTSFRIAIEGLEEPRLTAAATRLIERLRKQTGIPIPNLTSSPATLILHCEAPSRPVQSMTEDESYRLTISPQQARIDAPNPLGILHGIATFAQLVAPMDKAFAAPVVTIDDQPRFPWRGLHIDVSRHFMPVDVLLRNLDGMAAVKLNVFHWHLSDDQGFRVESRLYPKLTGLGSDGLFYTQEQVVKIVRYARDRGIRVVPEFDIPGHATSWLVGYPELASAPGPYAIEREWGIFDPTFDPSKPGVYTFLDRLIGEMARLFPDEYFHIGGDEVNGKQWTASQSIQSFLKTRGWKDNHELHSNFNKRVQAIVHRHGKIMIGWDEILDPALPKSIVIQSWRGPKAVADAVRIGYAALLSAGYYLDQMETAAQHYLRDPLADDAAALDDTQRARVYGGEVCMWTEFTSPETLDSRIWPRTAAMAERFWSPQAIRDVDSMYRRLDATSRNLEWLGLTHRSNYPAMLARLAGETTLANEQLDALRTMVDVVEPVKGYTRGRLQKYTSATPLNRLVDAARPESDVAREFVKLAAASPQDPRVRRMLAYWRDNDARVQPVLKQSFLLSEAVPLSQALSAVAGIGIEALDVIEKGARPSDVWVAEKTALLKAAKEPHAEVLIMIVPAVERFIALAASRI